ncbi:MAG: DUF3830 family protein [Burkholderiales bacterium]
MPKLEFRTARGEAWVADIFVDMVPVTWQRLREYLPRTIKAYNARWSGRETHTTINLPQKPPRENQILYASTGDVIYACEWPETRNYTGFEAIGWFYAGEVIRDWRGDFAVNHIGRINPGYFPLIDEFGNRSWKEGGQDVALRAIDD